MLPKDHCLRTASAFLCKAALLVAVAATPAFGANSYVPVVARGAGAHGSFTQTDLWLTNSGGSAVSATLHLWKSGLGTGSNEDLDSKSVDVPAGNSVRYTDVVSSLFGRDEAVGALFVECTGDLAVGSRTYDTAAGGTYGELLPGVADADAVAPGQTGHLLMLAKGDRFRSNLGIVNIGSSTLTLNVALKSTTGGDLGFGIFQVPGHGHAQVNDVFTALGAFASAQARLEMAGDQPFLAYSSVVDNDTNDPTIEVARSLAAASRELLLPVAARAEGANGSRFRSDLRVVNPNAYPVLVTMIAMPRAASATGPWQMIVPPGQTLVFDDVLRSVFGLDGTSGPIRLSGTGPILAFSRLYNDSTTGTSGQAVSAVPFAATVYPGAPVELNGLSKSDASRSNAGFVNTSDRAVRFSARLVSSTGDTLGSKSTTLDPGGSEQWNDLFAVMGAAASVGATLRVETSPVTPATSASPENSGAYVWGSLVDNVTGDPSFIAGRVVRPSAGIAVLSFRAIPDTVCGTSTTASWDVAGATTVKLVTADGEATVAASGTSTAKIPSNRSLRLVASGDTGTMAVMLPAVAESTPAVSSFTVLQDGPVCPNSAVTIRYKTTGADLVFLQDGSAFVQPLPASSPEDGLQVELRNSNELTMVAANSCSSATKTATVDVWARGVNGASLRAFPDNLYFYRWGQTNAGCCLVKFMPLTSQLTIGVTDPDHVPIESIVVTALYGTIRGRIDPAGGTGSGMVRTWTAEYNGPAEWVTDEITVTVTDQCGNVATATDTVTINVCFPPEAIAGCACPPWCDSRGSDASVPWYDCADELFGWCTYVPPPITDPGPPPVYQPCSRCFYQAPNLIGMGVGKNQIPFTCVDEQN